MPMLPLTDEDKISILWRKIEASLREHLEAARKSNDGIKSEADTNFVRGRIAVLKALINE